MRTTRWLSLLVAATTAACSGSLVAGGRGGDGGGARDGGAVGGGQDAGPGVCGNDICNSNEDCATCPSDCGMCPACAFSPSCSDAVGAPVSPTSEPNLDVPDGGLWMGSYGGTQDPAGCGPAKLSFRLASIKAIKNDGQPMYCVVQASDGVQSGFALTGKTSGLSDGQSYSFDPSVGLFWGNKGLTLSQNNMTITYNCFQVDKDVWGMVLMAAGNAAGMAGAIPGNAYGWAFGLGDVGLQAAGAAIAASAGDKNLFNAQQVIDKHELLDLTNGKTWTVEASGGSCGGFLGISTHPCDWVLTIEAWGCADGKPIPN